jgi:hypothetical protein
MDLRILRRKIFATLPGQVLGMRQTLHGIEECKEVN